MDKKQVQLSLIHLIAYSLLLIATPFLLLKNYMQTAVGRLSEMSFQIFSIDIPYVLVLALIIVASILTYHKRSLTRYHFKVLLVIIFLLILAQNSTDFYFNHKFYELQHNWHYLAYSIFSYFGYQYFFSKGLPLNKIILYTFLFAGTISIFDEAVQVPLSSRIFDICDIAKDLWGVIIGMTFILFVIKNNSELRVNQKIRQARLRDYISIPFTLLFHLALFAYCLLFVSSLLTEIKYLPVAILLSFITYFIIFIILHLSQFKRFGITLLIVLSLTIGGLITSNIISNGKKVQIIKNNIILYYGVPIPYFDVMIHNNGLPRVVDKKSFFNSRDQKTIFKYSEDILLIGTRGETSDIQGFPESTKTQFIFNHYKNKGLQVIILNAEDSEEKYNNLIDKGLNVLYIIHQK